MLTAVFPAAVGEAPLRGKELLGDLQPCRLDRVDRELLRGGQPGGVESVEVTAMPAPDI